MKQRLITAAVLLGVLAVVLLTSGTIAFPFVAAFFCAFAVFEMQRCLGTHKKPQIMIPSALLSIILPFGTLFVAPIGEGLTMGIASVNARLLYLLAFCGFFVVYLFVLLAAAVFSRRTLAFSEIAAAFMTTFYITLAFAAIPLVRFGTHGQYYYLLCFLGPWITDSFAYFTGVFFGKHKLIPEISPKKTIEGSIGGIVFCVISFVVFGLLIGNMTGSTPNYLVLGSLGFLVAVVAQLGDLFASLIKRERGVKDYSNIFPGHGGVMDRFDSVIATAPMLLIACTLDSLLSINLLL